LKIQKERDHSEDVDIDRRIILKRIIEKWDGVMWIGLIRLRIGTNGVLLCTR
jgi:hypothetical protein